MIYILLIGGLIAEKFRGKLDELYKTTDDFGYIQRKYYVIGF